MRKMTDEEILKRLAEIEGIKSDLVDNEYAYGFPIEEGLWFWNPLTDWSDLGPLIEKYKVWVEWYCHNAVWDAATEHTGYVRHESLPHAICLAIIEANQP